MVLTTLEIRDKTFTQKIRGYDAEEVREFLDIVGQDYEQVVRERHSLTEKVKALEGKVNTFEEMKELLSQSIVIAQETAEKMKAAAENESAQLIQEAEYRSQLLLNAARTKANDMLRMASDSAKRVAVETDDLKNKSRVFHERLKSFLENQLSIVDSPEWEELLRPMASYVQTSDDAFEEVFDAIMAEAPSQSNDSTSDLEQPSPQEDIPVSVSEDEAMNLENTTTLEFPQQSDSDIVDTLHEGAQLETEALQSGASDEGEGASDPIVETVELNISDIVGTLKQKQAQQQPEEADETPETLEQENLEN